MNSKTVDQTSEKILICKKNIPGIDIASCVNLAVRFKKKGIKILNSRVLFKFLTVDEKVPAIWIEYKLLIPIEKNNM